MSPKIIDESRVEVVEEDRAPTLDHVDQYLMVGKESGASDIHLAVSSLPSWRRFGALEPIWLKAAILTAADTERLTTGFLADSQWRILAERGDVDFAYANSLGRFRASIVKQRLGYDLTFRIINSQVTTMSRAGIASAAQAIDAISQRSGAGDRLCRQRKEHDAGGAR